MFNNIEYNFSKMSSDMYDGIYILQPIGRSGNHLLTIFNAIYLGKKYNFKWIKLDHLFRDYDKYINIEYNKSYNECPSDLDEGKLLHISGFMVFHLTHYLGNDNIIDYTFYRSIFREYLPIVVSSSISLTNPRPNYDKNTTLFTHLKCTDNLLQNLHYKYNILPVDLYRDVMENSRFNTLVIVTDNPQSQYLTLLKERIDKIGKKMVVEHNSLWEDMMIINHAKYLLMDCSTFTWICHLTSPVEQKVLVWEQFFSVFLAKYRQYVDITLFNKDVINNNYTVFELNNFTRCGEWTAMKHDIDLLFSWDASNNLKWDSNEKYLDYKIKSS